MLLQGKTMTKIRWLLVITIIYVAVLAVGYRLTQPEPETVAAAPVPPASVRVKTESILAQAMTIEAVETRGLARLVEPVTLFESSELGFHLSYPATWQTLTPSTTMAVFKSPDGTSLVKVEAVGPRPADGLAPFVDRSLGPDAVLSRQMLTIHGQPAERVLVYSKQAGGQVTTFYIDVNGSIFVVTGVGEQRSIELIARSFNGPLAVAQR